MLGDTGNKWAFLLECILVENKFLLPSTKLRQGNIFTGFCHSVHRGRGHVWRGSMRARRDGHCSGRYASYWNAFLFLRFFFGGEWSQSCMTLVLF